MNSTARRWPTLDRREILDAIVRQKCFADLPTAQIEKIAALAIPRRYCADELVHCKLDPAAGLYGILSGRVRISSANAEGRESVFSFMGPGAWFGHIGLIDGLPRTHDIRAVEDSVILFIHHGDFHQLLEENLILYKHFALKLCELIREAFSAIDDGMLLTIEARLAKRLLALADSHGAAHPEGTLIDLPLPQRELASMLNVTRQTVNRKLAEWNSQGWIAIHYGHIVVVERRALEQLFPANEISQSTAPRRHGTNS
jgi:CRP/FNR family transcriptional regulator, cyclic AMP receptor protein